MSSSFKLQDTNETTTENVNFSIFDNQISGHSCLLKDPEYLYKPYDHNEAEFYESIEKQKDHPLSNFIPAYHGIYDMPKPLLEEFASNVREDSPSDESEDRSNEEEIRPSSLDNSENNDSDSSGSHSRTEWFKTLLQNRLNEIDTKFLKLQDLTSASENPCMLDLKMGSLPYNKKKLAHQASKLEKTTSSSLGFRICGLQVKNPESENEYFRDKYWGRKLKQEDMAGALALFFFDGQSIRRNLIQQFLRLLSGLTEAIKATVGYNFYSVSLLLIYDSSVPDQEFAGDENIETHLQDKIHLKLIDFAKSKYTPDSNEPDTDLLGGIQNLTRYLREIEDDADIKPCLS